MPDLKPEDLATAERLAELEFSPGERELVVKGLPIHLAMYARRRGVELPNGLGPATRFDPRLPGLELDTGPSRVVPSAVDPGPLPDSDDVLYMVGFEEAP